MNARTWTPHLLRTEPRHPAQRETQPVADRHWPLGLMDRWFDAWARRVETVWAERGWNSANDRPTPYY
jgi:hypothetical protein